MVDIGTLSLILLLGMFALLAIGMPLGFASAFLAVVTLMLKFDPSILFGTFGRGPLSVLGQAVYRQMTNYVLISIPLFIFMAALLERSGIARDMYSSLNVWLRLVGADSTTSDAASGVRQKLGDRYDLRIRFIGNHDPALNCVDLLWIGDGNLDQGAVYSLFSAGVHVGDVLFAIYIRTHPIEPSIGTFSLPGSG